MIETTGQAERNQRRLIKGNTGDARAQTEQDNADVFQGVVRQQTLNVMFHQRIQTADKRGDHAEHQQQNAPPQRRIAANQR